MIRRRYSVIFCIQTRWVDVDATKLRVENCISAICRWIDLNELNSELNHDQMEVMLIQSKYRPSPSFQSLCVDQESVAASRSAWGLGVIFDEHMSFHAHVSRICISSFYHLRNLSRIRKYLTKESAAVVVYALVTSKLDYCNAYNHNRRHFKIEICGRLSVLRWFHVGHVVRNGQSVLALAWHEWCSCKGRERKIFCCALVSRCRQNLKSGNFTSSFGSQKISPKCIPHVQRDYFSFFNQKCFWFVTLSLQIEPVVVSWTPDWA